MEGEGADFFDTYDAIESKDERVAFCLEWITAKLKNGSMSAMVGAGFSKNADPNYKDWSELLVAAWRMMHPGRAGKEKVKRRIKIEGESKVASEYVNFMGSREALDLYIESRFKKIAGKTGGNEVLDLHRKFMSLNWNNVITTNWDDLLERAARESPITATKDLKRADTSKIIKINGSLRVGGESDESAGFDNCKEHLYIITQEDFDTYAVRHDGFSDFMRIRFLVNSFCLFGFSGRDPNFRYWMRERNRLMEKGGESKSPNPIFLVAVEEQKSTRREGEALKAKGFASFCKKNHIVRLPVADILRVIAQSKGEGQTLPATADAIHTAQSLAARAHEQLDEFITYLVERTL